MEPEIWGPHAWQFLHSITLSYPDNPTLEDKNNHAQFREQAKWVEPDPKKITKRFCQSREEAQRYAKSLNDEGYHVQIKTDGMGHVK